MSNRAFIDRLLPAPVTGGFAMDDFWVWCGSVIRGPDGKFHMFASCWPKSLPFFEGYLLRSQIVRALADTPEGPYAFQEVVLGPRGNQYWDGLITHNPTIHFWNGIYYLFYIGSRFSGSPPKDHDPIPGHTPQASESWLNIRIGVAKSTSLTGPWERMEEPLLLPRKDKWDAQVTTNPAPVIHPDGRVLMVYRSGYEGSGTLLGVAGADRPEGPYRRLVEDPILLFNETDQRAEDPFIWWADDHYEMLMKDMKGGLTGEKHAGTHATSPDGLHWTISNPPKAYSRTVRWSDGRITNQGCLERPQLLIQNGTPTHLFAATGDGPGGFYTTGRTWTMVIPIAPL
jgi:hypothetical protein